LQVYFCYYNIIFSTGTGRALTVHDTNRCRSHHDQLTALQTHVPNWLSDQPTKDTCNYCHWRMCM